MLAGATTTSSSFVTGLTNEVSTTRRRGNTPGPSKDILQQCYNFDSTRYGDAGRQKQKRNKHGNTPKSTHISCVVVSDVASLTIMERFWTKLS